MAKYTKHHQAKFKHRNEQLARAMQDLRRSSAAQPHTLKQHKGARAERRAQAILDQREVIE